MTGKVYVNIVGFSPDADITDLRLERTDGGSVEGMRLDKEDGLPVIYLNDQRLLTVPVGTNACNGQGIMTVRVALPDEV